ncbi:MAG: XdhC/CoxI family protein [Candidatus Hydrogenedentes bacterium]|nr:XdhC/CoxI family protein [Candidatus Hydrogenedentota bacterium]
MSESGLLLEELLSETSAGRRCALCAVVHNVGSTPRRPGAALLVREDRSIFGTLGGGCVEAEVILRVHRDIMPVGGSAYMEFNLNHTWGWDDGLVCGGRMDIAAMTIAQSTDLEPYRLALESIRDREKAWYPIIAEKDDSTVEYRIHVAPTPTLVVAGAGHIGQALARCAVDLDFHVVIIDDRKEFATPERFPPKVEIRVGDIDACLEDFALDSAAYVVIVTRGHKNDQRALEAVIDRPVNYIGLLGSKRKRQVIFDDIVARGLTQSGLDEVHCPIGISIGAETVPEIAISILAEIIKVRRKTPTLWVEGPID